MKNATTIFSIAILSLLASCTSCPLGHETTSACKVEHVVLIWLKNPGDKEARQKVIETAKIFQAEIPQIQHLSVGTPLASERPVVDDSFDVGLVMRFANQGDLATYEKHPVHEKAVKDILQPLAKKLLVYDVVTH